MSIFVTGDLHGAEEILRFDNSFSKEDIIFITGDFGGIWYAKESKWINKENYFLNWYQQFRKATLLCVLGNHENFSRIYNDFPVVNLFGAEMYKIRENIYYIKHDQYLTIEDKTFYVFGGACSVDKEFRIDGQSWWKEEQADWQTQNKALANLKPEVDYILSHTCPDTIVHKYFHLYDRVDNTSQFLREIHERMKFKRWYFGHMHEDRDLDDKLTVLYKTIERLR